MSVRGSTVVRRAFALALLAVFALAVGASAQRAITIDEAIERALANDISAKIAQLQLETAQVNYQKSVASNLLTASTVNELTAETSLRNAQLNFENQQGSVISSTVSAYFGVLVDELTLGIRQAQLEIANLNLESARRRAGLGTASQLDVLDAETDAVTSRLSYESAQNALRQRKENLAASLGLASIDEVVLDAEIVLPKVSFSLEDGIAAAMERSSSILSARTDLEVARIDLSRAIADGVAPLDLRLAQIAVERAELQLEQAVRSVENSVISAFQQVTSAADNLGVEDSRLAAAVQRYEVILQQHDAGLRTDTERISAEVTLAQAKVSHFNALSSYFQAVLSYRLLIGEPVVSGGTDAQ